MTKNEKVIEKSGLFNKEQRQILYREIKIEDIPNLYNALREQLHRQHNHKLHINIGRSDAWFNNAEEFALFLRGFASAMRLLDDDFVDEIGMARRLRVYKEKRIIGYTIVSTEDYHELIDEVQEKVDEDWEPVGGIAIERTIDSAGEETRHYYQALVLFTERPDA